METKKLIKYDMARVIARAKKNFGTITKGTEEFYNPQLNYIEHAIYDIYQEIPINDRELQEVIEMIIYDLKGLIENKKYDYSDIRSKSQKEFALKLQALFNPFVNEEIKKYLKNDVDLKTLFTFPIMCLLRIYDSIDFWHNYKGINGYYKMLEEMVIPIVAIGKHPFALDDEYLNVD